MKRLIIITLLLFGVFQLGYSQQYVTRKTGFLKSGDSTDTWTIPNARTVTIYSLPDTAAGDTVKVYKRIIFQSDTAGSVRDTEYVPMGLKCLYGNIDDTCIGSTRYGREYLLFDPQPIVKQTSVPSDTYLVVLKNAVYSATRRWEYVVDFNY